MFGSVKMLGIYLGSGALASFATYKLKLSPYALGASGGLFGLTGAMVAYYEVNRGALGRQSEAGKLVEYNVNGIKCTSAVYNIFCHCSTLKFIYMHMHSLLTMLM